MERLRAIFACLFGANDSSVAFAETFSEVTASFNGAVKQIDVSALHSALDHLNGFAWNLRVTLNSQESPHTLSVNDLPSIEVFSTELQLGAQDDPEASATLFVQKPSGDSVPVFSPVDFFSWFGSLQIKDALVRLDRLVADYAKVEFVNPTFNTGMATACFRFVPEADPLLRSDEIEKKRAELVLSRRELVTSDWNALRLFPDDFSWTKAEGIAPLKNLFAQLENFLCVVSLADSTLKNGDGVAIRVKGHVVREQSLNWNQIPSVPDLPLRNLFQWCYRSSGAGPLSDKLGLLRNYVSLYWNESIFGQDLTVVAAVRSGFGMYLKRNLKEFIELRAKVAAFLLELDAKATKAIETATGNLEKNLYGVVTFVTSVVLLKAIQDKSFSGAFSPQVALLGWVLVVFSAIHAYYAWWSTDKEMDRASQLYSDLRKLYSAFFTEADFDSIFSSDEKDVSTGQPKTVTPIERTKVYVRSRLKTIMWVWGITLGVAAMVIGHLRANTPTMPSPTKQPVPLTGQRD